MKEGKGGGFGVRSALRDFVMVETADDRGIKRSETGLKTAECTVRYLQAKTLSLGKNVTNTLLLLQSHRDTVA